MRLTQSSFSGLFFFLFNDTATTEIYTLSLHDALPIFLRLLRELAFAAVADDSLIPLHDLAQLLFTKIGVELGSARFLHRDRKSTRLNSSHANISYAVFCLKKQHQQATSSAYRHSSTIC